MCRFENKVVKTKLVLVCIDHKFQKQTVKIKLISISNAKLNSESDITDSAVSRFVLK
jgi:hypothetical protein